MQTTVTDLVCHAPTHDPTPVPGNDQSPKIQWSELLYVSDEIAHLRQVSHCLAEYERVLSRLELENAQLRNMESDLLERAEVSERGLRLARESRRHKDQEIDPRLERGQLGPGSHHRQAEKGLPGEG